MTLAGVPALIAHPDWATPGPALVWMHGRTAFKELDAGRYLRCVRAGIAAVALDLPMHGERAEPDGDKPASTLRVVARMVGEIDGVVSALLEGPGRGVIDGQRIALGGMSAGGMATLRRICDAHPFVAAHVEGTTGDLRGLYASGPSPMRANHEPGVIAALDPSQHLAGFRPIPLQALHATGDRVVAISLQRGFLDRLRAHYSAAGADAGMVTLVEFSDTGAPEEHAGFGRSGHAAKEAMVEFLRRVFFRA